MKRRSKAVGKASKARSRKATTPKRRNAPTTAHGRSSKSEFARLSRELNEALERETATAEILASLGGSTHDTRPVFETILDNTLRLLGTRFVAVLLIRDGMLHVAGLKGDSGIEKLAVRFPVPVDDEQLAGKVILTGRVLQVVPIIGNPDAPPRTQKLAIDGGYNALLSVPLIHQGKVIGSLNTAHRDPISFTEKQIALVKNFAAQAALAIENARLFEAEQQRTRTFRVAGAADCNVGSTTRDQQLDVRLGAGVQHLTRNRDAVVRIQHRRYMAAQRRLLATGQLPWGVHRIREIRAGKPAQN